jgi:hypothetical protein
MFSWQAALDAHFHGLLRDPPHFDVAAEYFWKNQ